MENHDRLIEYILGGLSEADRERIEEEYFVNNETWEKLRAVEDDLIDSYVRGKLPPSQREQFDKYFLASSGKRQRVEFARHLNDVSIREAAVEEREAQGKSLRSLWLGWRPAMRFAVAAVALVLAALAVFFPVLNVRLRRELSQARSHEFELQSQIQTVEQQLAEAKKGNDLSGKPIAELIPSQMPVVSVMLTSGLVRNGKNSPYVLPVPATPAEVLLLLSLESDEYPQYEVLLRTAEGREIRHIEGLNSQPLPQGERAVAVRLPAQLFSPGDYIVTLSGKPTKGKPQTVDSYTFSVRPINSR